ncbi:MAG: RNA polymerase sigma factor [Polyangiaceae bacterium]
MTDSPSRLHSLSMAASSAASEKPASEESDAPHSNVRPTTPSFESIYEDHFPYIWRSIQRLGVSASQTDDVVQEVFIIAHRKLATFEGRSSIKTWLYGIALHVARLHRSRARKNDRHEALDEEAAHAPTTAHPDRRAETTEAARAVNAILDGMDDDQREVFVLAELEELSAPEIAGILDEKLNTIYSRLRLAREAFAKAAARYRAQDDWRTR